MKVGEIKFMIMKKMILGGIAVVMVAVLTAVSVNLDAQTNFEQANVAALESLESGGGPKPCGGEKINGECQCRNTVNCKDLFGCQ
jgi:hypothetical protein